MVKLFATCNELLMRQGEIRFAAGGKRGEGKGGKKEKEEDAQKDYECINCII